MSSIKLEKVVSFSSEAKAFPASNLLTCDKYKKWQTRKPGEGKAFVIVKLERPSVISGIDIGNAGSAFIEVFASTDNQDFCLLLPTSSFMSPMEARNDEERERVRMFTKLADNASGKSWAYIKVVCSQPFNKTKPFGITFIRVHGPSKADTAGQQDECNGKDISSSKIDNEKSANSQNSENEAKSEPKKVFARTPKKSPIIPSRGREIESDDSDNERERRDQLQPSTFKVEYSKKRSPAKKPSQRPANILQDVVFVLSGFQNPLRSQIRSQALAMGASYMADWNERCTHLVCAFPNTPKWTEVAKTGGRIVTRSWIDACEKAGKQVGWRDFKCGKYRDKVLDVTDTGGGDSEVEEEEEYGDDGDSDYTPGKDEEMETSQTNNELEEYDEDMGTSMEVEKDEDLEENPNENQDNKKHRRPDGGKKNVQETVKNRETLSKAENFITNEAKRVKVQLMQRQDESISDNINSEELDVPEWDGGDLGRFFAGRKFHIKDDVDDKDERGTLEKYIIAHCGNLTRNPSTADVVVSWDAEGEITTSSKMRSPLWVVKCHQENRFIED
ncbi:transient receptor potential channel 2 isoform 3-like [Tropilaelaps mercedesae]|uniref:Transient receptor potential channel 2 isoform 3-like n=1 Tax=Tropilaelaps mercedesae TaxID=418985 RepID=A0A1V9X6X2_9ACAR|nr:transient receptor potential channel 2 isoform 3-like [Tropilaelaps mercedesae]